MRCHEFCQRVPHHSEDLAILFIGMPLGCLAISCVPHGNRAGVEDAQVVPQMAVARTYISPFITSPPLTGVDGLVQEPIKDCLTLIFWLMNESETYLHMQAGAKQHRCGAVPRHDHVFHKIQVV
ncbi:uncharacterized protein [Miscanthus floridulus]|uniref:uncharacterized protein n=1 Tax=Miscanthus floridulus TaxID=154761 RepID=UPI0034599128